MFLLPESIIEVKKTKRRGRGVFALKPIEGGRVIGDYLGKVIGPKEEEKYDKMNGFYLLDYTGDSSIAPDLESSGPHLLNHSCSPNCESFQYHGHTLFFASRKIFPGEELTINYYVFPDPEEKFNFQCLCKSPVCRGTMFCSEKKFDQYNDFIEKTDKDYNNIMEVEIGEYLPPLKKYPKFIKDYPVFDIFGNQNVASLLCEESKLPPKKELRKRIRQSGRCLNFKKLNISVFGLMDGHVIIK